MFGLTRQNDFRVLQYLVDTAYLIPNISTEKPQDTLRFTLSTMTREELDLPYGDGSYKVFGMENFGNSCYCNSILQCLFHTTKFREKLLRYKYEPHERVSYVQGQSTHNFTFKYEQLYQKRLKEQGKVPESSTSGSGNGAPPLTSRPSIRNSIFGKFSSNSTPTTTDEPSPNVPVRKLDYVYDAGYCDALNSEQRAMIKKHPELHNLQIFVTRPLPSTASMANEPRNDNSTSSTALLEGGNNSNTSVNAADSSAPITPRLCFVVVGIPQPETALVNPINPFNPNPASDQRKRSALINGPIINLDHPLRQPDGRSPETALLYALKDIFEAMAENKSKIGVVSPNFFIGKLKEKNALFRQVNMHQDAHEFCNYLINETIESINLELGAAKNWCTDIFQGTITNETKCLSCETVTSKDETFLDLSIDIPPGDSAYSLTYSLNNFSRLEILSHQNKFYCNTCLSLQEAVKTIKLKSTPDVLIINFKRFKYDDKVDRMVKLFDSISYPLRLRLFNTTKELEKEVSEDDYLRLDSKLYGLYALVVHIGGGPMHGHYVALCKCQAGLWFLFDDETVEIVDESYVLRFFGDGPGLASAYILFYEKVDTKIGKDGETHDFGIDINAIYNGQDYSLSLMKPRNESESSVPVSRPMNGSLVEDQNDEDSVRDFVPESLVSLENSSIGLSRKTSIFKKTFMFDSNKDNNGINDQATRTASRASSNKDGVENMPPTQNASSLTEPKLPPPVMKKSWVNGLKRRDLKVEMYDNERKGSQGSILTNNSNKTVESKEEKKKRGFFSFKKKSKS